MSRFHSPNQVPRQERIWNTVLSVCLFAYGSHGVLVNDLYLPGKRSRGIHLHDMPAWVMFAAIACACLVMMSVVVDHYDLRDNERHYRRFAETFKFIGWGLAGAALFWTVFH